MNTLIYIIVVLLVCVIIAIPVLKFRNKKIALFLSNNNYEIVEQIKFGRNNLDNFVVIKKNDKYGFCLNFNKNTIIEPIYDDIKPLNRNGKWNMIPVKKDGKWGFVRMQIKIKTHLHEAIPTIYDSVNYFEGVVGSKSLVTLDGKDFYINKNGEKI